MALVQVLNVLRLYLEKCPQPKYEMQEGARAPSAPPPSWATVEDKQYKLQEKLSTAVSIKEFVIKDKDKIKTM